MLLEDYCRLYLKFIFDLYLFLHWLFRNFYNEFYCVTAFSVSFLLKYIPYFLINFYLIGQVLFLGGITFSENVDLFDLNLPIFRSNWWNAINTAKQHELTFFCAIKSKAKPIKDINFLLSESRLYFLAWIGHHLFDFWGKLIIKRV